MPDLVDARRTILYALGANISIAIAKLLTAFYSGSQAMLAEAVHSFADCINQALLIVGMHRAKRPANEEHPLGYGMAIYFWSFIVALMLFSMGGLYSIYEGWNKLSTGSPLSASGVAIVILLFSIAMEAVSLRACLREVDKTRGRRSFWRWFRETRHSELVVVIGEDLAALAGLIIALVAITLAAMTGDPFYDAAGSILIGALLIVVAHAIATQGASQLIGKSVEPEMRRAIDMFLGERHEIDRVYNLITLQLGDDIMVAVKARMSPSSSASETIVAINACEKALTNAFPRIRWVFFEPDDRD
ncbi:MAG: cation diffusion facilitator family transporter [Methylotetracoccus sp.]